VNLSDPHIAEAIMRRFYFGLEGEQNVNDPNGLVYASELIAFQAGQRLAADLSENRPALQGSTCVMVAIKGNDDRYCISI
jgi:hypothetical protein